MQVLSAGGLTTLVILLAAEEYLMFVKMIMDITYACKSLLTGHYSFSKGIFKAHWAFSKWIFSNKNQNLFPKNKTATLHGLYKGCVVWQYFIKKKKTFHEIVRSKVII